MIKGDVNKLIEWLNLNDIQVWSLTTTPRRQDNSIVFDSNPDAPRESEISRMISILSLSENSVLYLTGKRRADSKTGMFSETWSNQVAAPQSVTGISATAPAIDVEKMVADAVEKERLRWRLEDMERKQKDLEDERKEFEREKNGVIGTLVKTAAPYLAGIMGFDPNTANVAIAGIKDVSDMQQDDDLSEEEDTPNEDAARLAAALKSYAEFDPDYIDVLCKLIQVATSGKPIKAGFVNLTYEQLKDMIMAL